MKVKQFEDKNLSHFSYAILSECKKEIVLVDPARDPKIYLDDAKENGSVIIGIIETHPHADFVSSHLELHKLTGATIYTSKNAQADYPHQPFDDGQTIEFGNIKLTAINTPGHSPDSISILFEHGGKQKAVFTGDTLFIGDCGRPDLRESAGKIHAKREELARQMYHSLREKLMPLDDNVIVYPAHGSGSLCGKNLSSDSSSTLETQKLTNWCLQPQTEDEFVKNLLDDQPFIPAYFSYDVELNRQGAPSFEQSVRGVKMENGNSLNDKLMVVDVRDEEAFKSGHHAGAINLMLDGKFETWLGTIIRPEEKFYLTAKDESELHQAIKRAAVIGYEANIEAGFLTKHGVVKQEELDVEKFAEHKSDFTIIDVRNASEVKEQKIFTNSISIPLAELRSRVNEIPTAKPIVVHCAGGYRSAAGSSLIKATLNGKVKVFDLGENIKNFK